MKYILFSYSHTFQMEDIIYRCPCIHLIDENMINKIISTPIFTEINEDITDLIIFYIKYILRDTNRMELNRFYANNEYIIKEHKDNDCECIHRNYYINFLIYHKLKKKKKKKEKKKKKKKKREEKKEKK